MKVSPFRRVDGLFYFSYVGVRGPLIKGHSHNLKNTGLKNHYRKELFLCYTEFLRSEPPEEAEAGESRVLRGVVRPSPILGNKGSPQMGRQWNRRGVSYRLERNSPNSSYNV